MAKTKQTRRERCPRETEQEAPWAALVALTKPHYSNVGRCEQHPMALESMLRTSLTQQWYSLSDPLVEGALYEIDTMRRFAGYELLWISPPPTWVQFSTQSFGIVARTCTVTFIASLGAKHPHRSLLPEPEAACLAAPQTLFRVKRTGGYHEAGMRTIFESL